MCCIAVSKLPDGTAKVCSSCGGKARVQIKSGIKETLTLCLPCLKIVDASLETIGRLDLCQKFKQ